MLPELVIFQKLKSNKNERILNTHILQFVFLGSTGFRFPFYRSVTDTASGHGLYLSIWQSGNMLINVGFKIRYITTDGAQTNKDLLKLLLPEFKSINPKSCSFRNLYNPDKEVFFYEFFSYCKKKSKNSISKREKKKLIANVI